MKDEETYTGRKIAIVADIHGLYQPAKAILEQCKSEGITEIYSLGDNIGDGPNPAEVIQLLENNGVKSVRGNAEEYALYGIEPFSYLVGKKSASALWTIDKVKQLKNIIEEYPVSIDLNIGGKNVALCHFTGDVRSYLSDTSTWTFQSVQQSNKSGATIFSIVNSERYTNAIKERYDKIREIYGEEDSRTRIAKSEVDEPLFRGKSPFEYDDIFQGHVHFKSKETIGKTTFHTLRGVEMGFEQQCMNNPKLNYDDKIGHGHEAYYIVLLEKAHDKGFDVDERYVPFDIEEMQNAILSCSNNRFSPISKFTETPIPYDR